MKETVPAVDERLDQLRDWLQQSSGISAPGEPASADASFRRYFRFPYKNGHAVAMDAPPPEDCRPFVDITARLAAVGLPVPEIYAEDCERGFLLLEDLGADTYLQALQKGEGFDRPIEQSEIDALFDRAIAALWQLQRADASSLPRYDEALLRRELDLFPEWFLQQHLGLVVDGELAACWARLCDTLVEQILAQSTCFVHRDFMPRNLMVSNAGLFDTDSEVLPGVLDFQDAVLGPVSYDAICLFKDAFVSWPEDWVRAKLEQFWQGARDRQLAVPESFDVFFRDCDWMGAHRHLKVIGIFARICHRDGKPHYLGDVPRFFSYLKTVAARRPELPLQPLLDELSRRGVEELGTLS